MDGTAAKSLTVAAIKRAMEAAGRARPRGGAFLPIRNLPLARDVIRQDPDIYAAAKTLWNMGYRGAGLNLSIPSNHLPVGTLQR